MVMLQSNESNDSVIFQFTHDQSDTPKNLHALNVSTDILCDDILIVGGGGGGACFRGGEEEEV